VRFFVVITREQETVYINPNHVTCIYDERPYSRMFMVDGAQVVTEWDAKVLSQMLAASIKLPADSPKGEDR
jgi:hypothetical protein